MTKRKRLNSIGKITCTRCGFKWEKRVEKPIQCPNCRSRLYFKPRKNHQKKEKE